MQEGHLVVTVKIIWNKYPQKVHSIFLLTQTYPDSHSATNVSWILCARHYARFWKYTNKLNRQTSFPYKGLVIRKQALNRYHAITVTNLDSLSEGKSRVLFENSENDWVGGGDSGEACNLTPEGPMGVSQKSRGKNIHSKRNL